MSRGEHHRIHAHDRIQRNRVIVAQEAARLMTQHGIRDFHRAKLKAAERLGILDTKALPSNLEIEQAVREHQRLFLADSQPQLLLQRRHAAVEAMRFLARFEPRLVGAVLEGTADAHSAVCLHVYCDDIEAVGHFLGEHGVPFETQTRRLREQPGNPAEYPVLLFAADDVAFDLTVLPHDALRRAPMDRIDDRPMRRASTVQVEMLLADTDADPDAAFERKLASAIR
jgi:hypothetical protein